MSEFQALEMFLQNQRGKIVERAIQYASETCNEMGHFECERKKKEKKTLPSGSGGMGFRSQEIEIDLGMTSFPSLQLFDQKLSCMYQKKNSISLLQTWQKRVLVENERLQRHFHPEKVTLEKADKWAILRMLRLEDSLEEGIAATPPAYYGGSNLQK